MEIKEVYLDLKEGPQYAKKNKSVFKLESEAFKDPLKLKFVYDDGDKKIFQSYVDECEKTLNILQSKQKELDEKIKEQKHVIDELSRIRDNGNELLKKANELINQKDSLSTDIKDIEKHNEKQQQNLLNKINGIEEYLKNNPQKKILRFHGEELINGFDAYFWDIEVPTGKYITIESYIIHPQNEYCINEDYTTYKTVYIEEYYNPSVQLVGSNAIDKPTALVELDIIFFQI